MADVGSGIGFVHNSYLFDRPQKSVAYAPFRIFPTPAWFATHRNLLGMAQKLLKFEADPSWQHLPGVVVAALRGWVNSRSSIVDKDRGFMLIQ